MCTAYNNYIFSNGKVLCNNNYCLKTHVVRKQINGED